VALTGAMVLRTTGAVMTGSTSTASSSWQTGGAQVGNDFSGSALFSTATDGMLVGGQTLTKCVVVTYVGTTAAAGVRLYVQSVTGSLKDYLNLTIDAGTSTSVTGDCTGFSGTTIYGPFALGTMAPASNDYATGLDTWAPTAGQKRTYRFTMTVLNVAAAQNSGASGVFTWEARTA
jgi:hypothetical protein